MWRGSVMHAGAVPGAHGGGEWPVALCGWACAFREHGSFVVLICSGPDGHSGVLLLNRHGDL